MNSDFADAPTRAREGIQTPHAMDSFADGEQTPFRFVPQPAHPPIRHAPLSELHEGSEVLTKPLRQSIRALLSELRQDSQVLKHPVVFVRTDGPGPKWPIIPVRGRGGEMDELKLEEIFVLLRRGEMHARRERAAARLVVLSLDFINTDIGTTEEDRALFLAKGRLAATAIDKYNVVHGFLEQSQRRLNCLREQTHERVRRLCPGFVEAAGSLHDGADSYGPPDDPAQL